MSSMKKIKNQSVWLSTLIVLPLFFVIGCEKQASIGSVDGKSITVAEYESYLKHKNVPLNDTERYKRMQEQYVQRAALAEAVAETDVLDQQLIDVEVAEFKKQLLISKYFEHYLNTSVSEEGIQNYYSAHPEQYQTEQVHVAHILFRVNPKMDETERNAILTSAHEAYSQLTSGEEFAIVEAKLSEDKVSGEKGGDLGWINKGAVAPEFSEKAFAMKKGDISEPFLTAFGFHVITVLDEPQVIKKPLEAVKGDIRYQLRNNAKQAETEKLLDTIDYSVDQVEESKG